MEKLSAASNAIQNLINSINALPREKQADCDALGALTAIAGLVDREYYRWKYHDVDKSGVDPCSHYAAHGWQEGRTPSFLLASMYPVQTAGAELQKIAEGQSYIGFLAKLKDAIARRVKPEILRQGAYETLYEFPMYVNWSFTHMCNYHCSYCFGQSPIKKDQFIPFAKYLLTIQNIAKFNRPKYHFTLVGGEPTVHPQFQEIFNLLPLVFKDRLTGIILISNGSNAISFYERVAELADTVPVTLNISLHTEFLKEDHIFALVKALNNKAALNFSLMYNPLRFDYIRQFFPRLIAMRKDYHFNLGLPLLRSAPKFIHIDERYTKEMFAWREQAEKEIATSACKMPKVDLRPHRYGACFRDLLTDGEFSTSVDRDRMRLMQSGLCNFQHMYCATGVNMLRVRSWGKVNGAVCEQTKRAFNIHDKNFQPTTDFFELVKCPLDNCGCSANDVIMKFRDQADADNFMVFARKKQEELWHA